MGGHGNSEQPWATANEEMGPLSNNQQPQGTKSGQQPERVWKQILPQSLQMRAPPGLKLTPFSGTLSREPYTLCPDP